MYVRIQYTAIFNLKWTDDKYCADFIHQQLFNIICKFYFTISGGSNSYSLSKSQLLFWLYSHAFLKIDLPCYNVWVKKFLQHFSLFYLILFHIVKISLGQNLQIKFFWDACWLQHPGISFAVILFQCDPVLHFEVWKERIYLHKSR